MPEFRSVRAPSYDVDGLVAKLNEAAGDGWDVVTIVPSSSDLVAILRKADGATASREPAVKPAGAAAAGAAAGLAAAKADTPAPKGTDDDLSAKVSEFLGTTDVEKKAADEAAAEKAAEAPKTEPAGWGTAPTPSPSPSPATSGPSPAATPSGGPTPSPAGPGPSPSPAGPGPSPSPAGPSPSPAAASPATPAAAKPATPAGWYPDPSGRYELRYWNGNDWSEHVARGGQQFTDPPVA